MQDEAIKAQWERGARGPAHAQRIGADRDINAARTPRPARTLTKHIQPFYQYHYIFCRMNHASGRKLY